MTNGQMLVQWQQSEKKRAWRGQRLILLSFLLLILTVGHELDHIRQGRALEPQLYGLMAVVTVLAVITFALAFRGQPLTAAVAAQVGFGNVVGPAVVHIAPAWGPFSDPFAATKVNALSWGLLAALMVTGLLLGLAGFAASGSQFSRLQGLARFLGGLPQRSGDRPMPEAPSTRADTTPATGIGPLAPLIRAEHLRLTQRRGTSHLCALRAAVHLLSRSSLKAGAAGERL